MPVPPGFKFNRDLKFVRPGPGPPTAAVTVTTVTTACHARLAAAAGSVRPSPAARFRGITNSVQMTDREPRAAHRGAARATTV